MAQARDTAGEITIQVITIDSPFVGVVNIEGTLDDVNWSPLDQIQNAAGAFRVYQHQLASIRARTSNVLMGEVKVIAAWQ